MIRKRFILAAVLILVGTFGVIMFFERCFVNPKRMDRIVVPFDDREIVITISDVDCKYVFDELLRKEPPSDGTLFMKNGKVYDILYDYTSFTIDGKYGYYVISGYRGY